MSNDLAQNMKLAMRRMASSVSIVATRMDGERFAMAATSVTSVSMDPPSVLVCVNRQASPHAALLAGRRFTINLLGRQHEAVSRACGGGEIGEDRFKVGDWSNDPDEPPALLDAQAVMVCEPDGYLPYGSHSIFIGKVTAVATNGSVDPLIYLDGKYLGA